MKDESYKMQNAGTDKAKCKMQNVGRMQRPVCGFLRFAFCILTFAFLPGCLIGCRDLHLHYHMEKQVVPVDLGDGEKPQTGDEILQEVIRGLG